MTMGSVSSSRWVVDFVERDDVPMSRQMALLRDTYPFPGIMRQRRVIVAVAS